VDDRDNYILSQKYGIAVISIPYRKGPEYPFPTAPHDCAAVIKAILDDDSLPVDKSSVAVGGYSAGGNMSLTAVQLDGLHDQIKGLVLYYPATNLARTLKDKLATSKLAPGRKNDMLERLGPMFNWAYIPAGTDKRDPLLSPYFAPREKLPKKMFFMGCEYDMLCQEALDMAENVAQGESGEKRTAANGDSWEKGGIRWELLRGLEHGFNQTPPKNEQDGKKKRKRQDEMQASVAKWLFKQVYTN
jgi:acetyl esterase/lipase